METRVSATEAVRSFSDVLNRVCNRGQEFVIERGGEAVRRMTPTATARSVTGRELLAVVREMPRTHAGFVRAVRNATKRQGRPPRSGWER